LAENNYDPIFSIQVGRDTFALTSEPAQAVAYVPEHTSTVQGHRRKKNKTGNKPKPAINPNVQRR
jgi:hypothetical protein